MVTKLNLKFTPDTFGQLLKSPFYRFESSCGIDGLAKLAENGTRIDILALVASSQGTGQFREFIRMAKQEFSVIGIWDIWTDELKQVLVRYGFTPSVLTDGGETSDGLIWSRECQ